MKKLLSYLWPQTHKLESEYSGTLEITWYNGKKLLDTKNANYSYGLLQKVLETGLANVDLNRINSVLLLGLGGGSAIVTLRNKFGYTGTIHAIELDAKIIEIAHDEFGISNTHNLTIEQEDASKFVKNKTEPYDLLIVDLFIDNLIPKQFLSQGFCEQLWRLTNNTILFNLGMDYDHNTMSHKVVDYFNNLPSHVDLMRHVAGKNTMLLVGKTNPNQI